MQQITTKAELNKALSRILIENTDICFNISIKIGDYEYTYPNFEEVVARAIDKEDYTLKKYLRTKTYEKVEIGFKTEYELIGEYDIKPLIKNILENRITNIEELGIQDSELIKTYREKLERM